MVCYLGTLLKVEKCYLDRQLLLRKYFSLRLILIVLLSYMHCYVLQMLDKRTVCMTSVYSSVIFIQNRWTRHNWLLWQSLNPYYVHWNLLVKLSYCCLNTFVWVIKLLANNKHGLLLMIKYDTTTMSNAFICCQQCKRNFLNFDLGLSSLFELWSG